MFENLVLQFDPSSLTAILPLLICCMLPLIMRLFQKPSKPKTSVTDTDIWFTSYKIEEANDKVNKYIADWRSERLENLQSKPKFSLFSTRAPVDQTRRFVIEEEIIPRLLKFSDPVEGYLTFEFTETEAGGTAIRVNYSPPMKERIQKMRASFPLKLPLTAGIPCDACGKPILPDFSHCPFCGKKIKKK